jgi:hypothetical protein
MPYRSPHPAVRNQQTARSTLLRTSRDRGERVRDAARIADAQFPVQRDDDITALFTDAQADTDHGGAFLLRQQGKVRAQRLSPLPVRMLRPGLRRPSILPAPAACRPVRPARPGLSASRRSRRPRSRNPPPGPSAGPPAPPSAPSPGAQAPGHQHGTLPRTARGNPPLRPAPLTPPFFPAPGQAPEKADRSPCSKGCDRAW